MTNNRRTNDKAMNDRATNDRRTNNDTTRTMNDKTTATGYDKTMMRYDTTEPINRDEEHGDGVETMNGWGAGEHSDR